MPSHKIAKINSEVTRALSEIIFNEAQDDILKSLTITGAKVSKDLSYAKIYFTSLLDIDKSTIVKEVNEASGFLRTELAQNLNLRHTPILEFVYDDSIAYAQKIENIISEIHKDE